MIKIEDIKIENITNDINMKYITRGLSSSGLLELVINLPIDETLAKDVIGIIISKINKDGELKEGYLRDILTCPIYIKKENDYFKIIFPDIYIKFPWDKDCQTEYKKQITEEA